MEKDTKLALQVAKEIVVKFIEVGRISPSNFHTVFPSIYSIVLKTLANQDDTINLGAEGVDSADQSDSEIT